MAVLSDRKCSVGERSYEPIFSREHRLAARDAAELAARLRGLQLYAGAEPAYDARPVSRFARDFFSFPAAL